MGQTKSGEREMAKGPLSQENWILHRQGNPAKTVWEIPAYSDAWVTGQITIGPYSFINMVPTQHRLGLLQQVVLLRVEDHFPPGVRLPLMDKTDESRFHGGELPDELCALLSLFLGGRFEPSWVTREFRSEEDRFGSPRAEPIEMIPRLLVRSTHPRVPSAVGPLRLGQMDALSGIPESGAGDTMALIRAARAYQQGLWVCEAEPQLSWLLFVSAVESAAGRWHTADVEAGDLLRDQKPDFASRLEERFGQEAMKMVAEEISQTMRATWRFISFLETFCPDPPDPRTHESARLDWDIETLRDIFKLVYSYRSRALHGGTPFPLPMCDRPYRHEDWDGYSEVPMGSASAMRGGVWTRKDAPILLATFEHIARGAIVNWWASLGSG